MAPKKSTKATTPQPKKSAVAMLKQQKAPRSAPPGKSKPEVAMDSESDNEDDAALFAKIKGSMFQDAKLLKLGAAGSDESDDDMDDDSDDDDMDFSDEEDGDEKDSSIHTTRSGLKRQIAAAKALMVNGKSKTNPVAVSEKKTKTPQTKKTDTPNVKSTKTPTVKTPTVKTPTAQKKSETPAAEKAKTPKSATLKALDSKVASEKSTVTPGEKKKKDNLQQQQLTPSRKRKISQNDDKDSQDSGVGMSLNRTAVSKVQAEMDRRTLFVKNLPKDVTENELKKLSEEAQSIRIKSHNRLKKAAALTFAFLEYKSEAIAERNHKKLTGKKLRDQEMLVDFVGEKSKNRKEARKNSLKLYIGGYSESTTADELRALFRTAKSISFPKRTKGFCFAFYYDATMATAAYEKGQGLTINNVPLIVDYAKSTREENPEKKTMKKAKLEAEADQQVVKKAKLGEKTNELDESDEDDDDYEEEEGEEDDEDDSDMDEGEDDDDDDEEEK